MRASFRSLGRSGQTRYIPSSTSLSPSPSLALSLPLSLPLRLPRLFLKPSPLAGEPGEVGRRRQDTAICQPAADVPGADRLTAEVSYKESPGPGTRGQAVSLSALGVTTPPPVMVLANTVSLTT